MARNGRLRSGLRNEYMKRLFLFCACVVGLIGASYFFVTTTFFAPGFAERSSSTTSTLSVIFFDVGQGDATLIKTPHGNRILIDAGPEDSLVSPLSHELGVGRQRIDTVILTHPHADHIEGMLNLLSRYEFGEIWYTGVEHTSPVFIALLEEIKKAGIVMKKIDRIERRAFPDDVEFEILFPDKDITEKSARFPDGDELNDTSIVARMRYKDISWLFMGDAERATENYLLKEGRVASSTALKVGHHGSRSSSSKKFLQAIAPRYAVISAGAGNEYGHPHQSALRRIARSGVQILRTDVHGTIYMKSDGRILEVRTEK